LQLVHKRAIGTGKDFLSRTPAVQQLRGKDAQIRLHEIKRLLHNKINCLYIEEITTHRVEENIASYTSDKGLINRIYRELKKLNSPKINEPIKKWETELNRTFSKEEVQMAKKIHEKLLTIPGHKGNANQIHTKISPHP
jgi:hypothetical protein